MVPLVFHPIYSQLNLPYRHRFPIEKYQAIRDALAGFGVPSQHFFTPQALEETKLCEVFCPAYIQALCRGDLDEKAMRRIGFPWSEQLIRRTLTAAGGTVLAAQLAMKHGMALNLTGGYHHAFADFGAGFCMVNDLYLAALEMLKTSGVDRVLIVDCDVHQGDGTAHLAKDDSRIITLSLHGEKNFPHRKQLSDMDFALPKGTADEQYLDTLDSALSLALRLYQPDAVIYDAGVDVHIDDDLGHLHISTQGVYTRDCLVLNTCKQQGMPVVAVIGGGYQRDIQALTQVHLQLFRAAGLAPMVTSPIA
ncbi:histone deacetylase [Aliiglaciecola sp. CAU 1673]|uniref:histone deacetylase family protein n=1 Tax=Aliiglaciecola sp. CAU 1673 TaxID=3032595 RepID=UPI0023DBD4DE|nr:histone deacetylase [Aliiglaciecola sp. CAU 1673]MDF2177451.1 histone deacetylase [Aliiglaciecola sp. CAU 1673]